MPSISFKGASGFTISGGNFSEVGGSVVTYNIGQLAGQQQIDQLPPLPSPEKPQRRHSQAIRQESIQQAPPSPSAASSGRVSTWATPDGSINHSPALTSSTLGIEERQHLGPSEHTLNQQQDNLELLTPLTDSLNLRRLTPSARSRILRPELSPSRVGHRTSTSPADYGAQASPLPSPPLPARPASLDSYPPPPSTSPYHPISPNQTPNPSPPPPLPPRPPTAASELEDRFAQLQVQHGDRKDYACESNAITHAPSSYPLSPTSGNSIPQQMFAQPNDLENYPSSGAQTPSAPPRFPPCSLPSVTSTTVPAPPLPSPGANSVNDGDSIATPQTSRHWTSGSISNWATNIRPSEGGYDSDLSQGSSTTANYAPGYDSPSPSVYNPRAHAYPAQHRGYAAPFPVPPPPPAPMFPQYNGGYAQPWALSAPQHPQQYQNYGYGKAYGYGGHTPALYLGSSGGTSFPVPSF